jgi:hypothetical protein
MTKDRQEEQETLHEAAARLLGRLDARKRKRASGRSNEPEQIQTNVIIFPAAYIGRTGSEEANPEGSPLSLFRATAGRRVEGVRQCQERLAEVW